MIFRNGVLVSGKEYDEIMEKKRRQSIKHLVLRQPRVAFSPREEHPCPQCGKAPTHGVITGDGKLSYLCATCLILWPGQEPAHDTI